MVKRRKSQKSAKGKIYFALTLLCFAAAVLISLFPQQARELRTRIEDAISQRANAKVDNGNETQNIEICAENFTPATTAQVRILKNIGYVSAFSNTHRIPLWVAYGLTYPYKYSTAKRPSEFITDSRVSDCPIHKDYSNSGYDRGHMAPNYAIGKCYGKQAQMETFYLTNILPQRPTMNRGIWKDMEIFIADKLVQKYGKVLVFVGPILDANPQKFKRISIPQACYAVIMTKDSQNRIAAVGFIVGQNPTSKNLWDYCVPIDKIESLTGIDFMPQLPDDLENRLESNANVEVLR